MSNPIDGIDQFAELVMAIVNADGDPEVFFDVAKGAIDWHASPPRAVWEPTQDRYAAAQKTPRGRKAPSMATRMAGAVVHLWADASPDGTVSCTAATERLIRRVVRAMVQVGGPSPFFELGQGAWNDRPGQTDAGRGYDLPFVVAVDMSLEPRLTVAEARAALDP